MAQRSPNEGQAGRAPYPVPVPYGAAVLPDGVQFTLFSRRAVRVWLMLFDSPDAAQPDAEYELRADTNRFGDIWHIKVPEARAGQFYLYRIEAPTRGGRRSAAQAGQWLLDPYALAVSGSPAWGETFGLRPGERPRCGPRFPKGLILDQRFEWGDDRPPRTPMEDTVIYEAHLRGYTVHPGSGVSRPGTYRGFMEKVPYLADLGITAVEFLPVHEFNEMEYHMENRHRKDVRNFWGYSTLAFFAPNGRYAAGGVYGQQVGEFKELVRALHAAGIEVILDVVFNHTAEQGRGGPTYSFRGIDNNIYYMLDTSGRRYVNHTGCGNTVNCNHPVVRQFILDCLRYWVLHLRVDGFRFDLASIFSRGQDGQPLANPPIVEAISEDPLLRDVKLIAEAWDAGGLYQVGSFPGRRWSEWNGRYRDDVRRFWKGDPGMLSPLATRLVGSDDLYNRDAQTPAKSINFITCHDGFTLRDLVSYEKKRNRPNRENNRDGESHNHSRNYGHEGPTADPAIGAVRKRQQMNFIATLLLSQGVPMLLAGDEFSRTQAGNNNAYCQDNPVSWVNWSLLEQHGDLHDFTRLALAFRRAHPALRQARFLRDHDLKRGPAGLHWLGPSGDAPDWRHGRTVAMFVYGSCERTGLPRPDDDILIILNAGEDEVTYRLPTTEGGPWELALSTQSPPPTGKRGLKRLVVDARSVNVLTSRPRE